MWNWLEYLRVVSGEGVRKRRRVQGKGNSQKPHHNSCSVLFSVVLSFSHCVSLKEIFMNFYKYLRNEPKFCVRSACGEWTLQLLLGANKMTGLPRRHLLKLRLFFLFSFIQSTNIYDGYRNIFIELNRKER